MEAFLELSLIILAATVVSGLMHFMRQPLIIGYIITGVLVGPYFFNILQSQDQIELFSKIGITILLFMVGLHLNPRVIKEVGRIALITGLGQIVFTSTIGYLIAVGLGYNPISALYIAIALTFSSTIIILKLLSDKGDLNKLYGKIAVGFLLVQDIVATLILLFVSSFGRGGDMNMVTFFALLSIKGLLSVIALYIISTRILPKLSPLFASSQELLFIFSITWGLGISALFYLIGFSIEIGALAAGVALSLSPFAYEIGSRMKPLRDFFITLFFVLLGSQMVLSDLGELIIPAIILSLFVLIGNPIIVVILMNLLGYKKRTGFMAGLTVAQISEFSLILIAMAVSVGHVSEQVLSLVTLVGLITIGGSTYMILYAEKIYPRIQRFLSVFEWRKRVNEKDTGGEDGHEIVLFGFDRVGHDFVQAFKKLDKKFLVVDFNPATIAKLADMGIPTKYGDAEDVEFLQELELNNVNMCVSTIPDFETNMLLVRSLRQANPKAIIFTISQNIKEARSLYEAGATYVMMPHYIGAQHVSKMIIKYSLDHSQYHAEKDKHMRYIDDRDLSLSDT